VNKMLVYEFLNYASCFDHQVSRELIA